MKCSICGGYALHADSCANNIHEREYQQYRNVQVAKRMLSLSSLTPDARQFWEEQLQQVQALLVRAG